MDFDTLIIGNGLIGSAASRYLSAQNERVGVLGMGEPSDYAKHDGAFASHYDQGRITRHLSRDRFWGNLASASIAQYRTIGRESGVNFWFPVGGLYVTQNETATQKRREVGHEKGVDFAVLDAESLAERFPMYQFPSGFHAVHERAPAGYINPRDLVRAQSVIARKQGATHVPDTAIEVGRERGRYRVLTRGGRDISADKILLTTGAFTNGYNLLPEPLPLRIKNEFVILGEVSAETAAHPLPFITYAIDHPDIDGIYQLPPIRYPNGHHYVKMGANTRADRTLSTLDEMRDWMVRGNADVMLPTMRDAVQAVMPTTDFLSWQMKRCLVTYTPDHRPMLREVAKNLFVAVGGNGSGAKSSNEIGRLAATLL